MFLCVLILNRQANVNAETIFCLSQVEKTTELDKPHCEEDVNKQIGKVSVEKATGADVIVHGPGPQKGGFHYQSRGKGSLCFLASLLCLEYKMM